MASGGCGRGCGFAWLRVEKNVNCLEFGLLQRRETQIGREKKKHREN